MMSKLNYVCIRLKNTAKKLQHVRKVNYEKLFFVELTSIKTQIRSKTFE